MLAFVLVVRHTCLVVFGQFDDLLSDSIGDEEERKRREDTALS